MPLALEDRKEIVRIMREELPILLAEAGPRRATLSEYELEMRERIVRVEEELKHQRELMIEGFKRIDERFEAVDKRFESMEKRFEARFEAIDKRFESMEKRFEARFEAVDKRFESMDKRFEDLIRYMDKRFESMDKRFESMDKRFEDLIHYVDKRFSVTQWMIGLGFGTITLFLGVLTYLAKTGFFR